MKIRVVPKSGGKVVMAFKPAANARVASAFLKASRQVTPVKFRKILATTDFSELSLEAVEYAMALAKEFRAKLSLLHVVEPSAGGGMEQLLLKGGDGKLVQLERKRLTRFVKQLSTGGLKISPMVRYGKPFREIAEAAREKRFDLIVTGTHGHTGLKRVLIGSTSEWVVRHAPCPVLTVPSESIAGMSGASWLRRIKRIMVPIDFSETSVKALPYAEALAATFRAEVVLIHVTEPRPVGGLEFEFAPADVADQSRAAEELLSHVQRQRFGEKIHTQAIVRSGAPFDQIVRAAARSETDLIILTTHGFAAGLKQVLMGSTAERVVRHASCPVLVVRDKQISK